MRQGNDFGECTRPTFANKPVCADSQFKSGDVGFAFYGTFQMEVESKLQLAKDEALQPPPFFERKQTQLTGL